MADHECCKIGGCAELLRLRAERDRAREALRISEALVRELSTPEYHRLRAALAELRDEIEVVMHGEHGADWADHFTPLFNLVQKAKALSGEHSANPSPDETPDARGELLQEWRDNCACGCDACVALIEALGLESAND